MQNEKAPDLSPPDTPATRAIAAFGGVQALAKAIDRDPSRVHRWTYPEERGGTGGRIPGTAVRAILAAAARLNIALSANDLFDIPASASEVSPAPGCAKDAA